MQNAQQVITQNLQDWLKEKDISVEFDVSLVENPKFGDFTANIAMVAIKKVVLRQAQDEKGFSSPRELAQSIVEGLEKQENIKEIFDKIEVAGPGFINFFLSSKYLQNTLTEIIQKDTSYGKSDTKSDQRIMVEFAHPNTHKEFHIGHLRNITLGESICRLLESQGTDLSRVNYQGDVGMHVAKALYGVKNTQVDIEATEKLSGLEKAAVLGKAYAAGSKSFEEEEEAKKEITTINKQIYARDPEIMPLWEKTRQWSLDYFDTMYAKVGTKYDRFFFESEVYESGKDTVLAHIEDGIFEKDEGAIIFPGKKFGLHNRVFITSEGNPTYEAKEMGLGPLEYKEFHFDKAIHVVGPEQAGYFEVVFKALEQVDPIFVGKEQHLSYGFVQLKDGKMSSRMGNIIRGEWLLDEAKQRIQKAFPELNDATAEIVAVGAVKYSMLKFGRTSDMQFSFDESISLEGNSGPYLQYAYVRTQSILKKSEIRNPKSEINSNIQESKIQNLESEENELLRFLTQFPSIVTQSAEQFAPNLLCNYLFELSQKFNAFYQKCNILNPVIASGAKQSLEDVREFRLSLTQATGIVIKNGLSLLGIQTVEKM